MTISLAQRKVLVLNSQWHPLKIVTLEKAMKKIATCYNEGMPNAMPKAEIIDCINNFRPMTWADWRELRPAQNYCQQCYVVRGDDEIAEGHKCGICQCKLGEDVMRTVNAIMRIPSVIRYTRCNKMPYRVQYNRRTIFRRDSNTCQYCGKKKPMNELSLDHVIPRCQGGLTTWENIVVACTDCNARKAGRTPKQARMTLIRQPKKPNQNFFPEDIRIKKDWAEFFDQAYWSMTLENDNKD